jgi:gliding motility-associated-like protein
MTRLLTILFFCLPGFLLAQAPAVSWAKPFGGYNGDYSKDIHRTSDGGYIAIGYTESGTGDVAGYHGNNFINDIWVIKLSSTGTLLWQKCLGGDFMETGGDIRETPDGGYIIGASSASVDCNVTGNHGGLDYWLAKIDQLGNIQWQKSFGGSKNEYAVGIEIAADGGYLLAAYTESDNGDVSGYYNNRDCWVIKTDNTGNIQWQKIVGGNNYDQTSGIRATPDGGCIMVALTESVDGDVLSNHGRRDYLVAKLNSSGAIDWVKTLGGSAMDEALAVDLTQDGGYIIAGRTGSNDGDVSGNHQSVGVFADSWIVKLSSSGNLLWQKCYGGSFNETAYAIRATMDGGYVIAGEAESADGDLTCNNGVSDLWVIKISSNGTLQWQKAMGGNYFDYGAGIEQLQDGSYIIAGNTCSNTIPGYHITNSTNGTCSDFWIIKLAADGIVPAPNLTIEPASGAVCIGTAQTFTATAFNTGAAPYYQWKKNGINVGDNKPTYTASDLNVNDVLTCTATSGGICENGSLQSTASVTIKANTNALNPFINISANTTSLCSNCTPVSIKATVTGAGTAPNYEWMVNGVNTGNATNEFITKTLKAGDVITCIYKDNSGCIAGGSVSSNAITMTGGQGQNVFATITPSANMVCIGTPVSFTVFPTNAGNQPSFQWQLNGVNAGTNSNVFNPPVLVNGDQVTCTVTPDPLSCALPAPVTTVPLIMIFYPKLTPGVQIYIPSNNNDFCTGGEATFIANYSDSGDDPSFQWKINGVNVGTDTPIFKTTALQNGDLVSCVMNADPAFLHCTIVPDATSNSIQVNVTVMPPPAIVIQAEANDVCKGGTVKLNAAVMNAGNNPSYQWMVNNIPVTANASSFSSSNLLNGDVVHCLLTPGSGTCSNGPVSSNTIVAIINDPPAVTISPADTLIRPGTQALLTATATGNISSVQWTPADKLENAINLASLTIPLLETTTYTLLIKTDKGCQAFASAIVKVGGPLLIPNAFTPNGDGLNDLFRIPASVFLELKEFSVFDRWGNKIFTTSDSGKGWDGTLKGKKLDTGAYIYFINGKDDKGIVSVKGTVMLVR